MKKQKLKMKKLLLLLSFIAIGLFAQAQNGLENIIVEKYYISNAADSIGSIGHGTLPAGSATYRIYADMLPGYKFQMAYGNANHNLKFTTSTTFYNNIDGYNTSLPIYSKTLAAQNTVMLDSWFSAGAACIGNYGVLKTEDNGVNNVVNIDGLLQNSSPDMGIPLTTQDGLLAGSPSNVNIIGMDATVPADNGADAVFGDGSANGNSFILTGSAWASLAGVQGPTATNRVLIGQITTNGTFHWELNIQIGTPTGGVEAYVVSNPQTPNINGINERTIPSLAGTYYSPIDSLIHVVNNLNQANYTIPSWTLFLRAKKTLTTNHDYASYTNMLTVLGKMKGANMPYNIVMNINKDPKTKMAFNWFTNAGVIGGQVQIVQGTATDSTSFASPFMVINAKCDSVKNLNYNVSANGLLALAGIANNTKKNYTRNRVLASGLNPDTQYSFRVGKNGAWSSIGTFRTAKATKEPFSFVYVTDPQAQTDAMFNTSQTTTHAAQTMYPNANFWLSCGDLVESSGSSNSEWEYEQFFETQQDIFMKKPFAPIEGNHDVSTNKNWTYHFNTDSVAFDYANATVPGSVYSYAYGDALIMSMSYENYSTPGYLDSLANWMTKQVNAHPDVKWRIANFHKTMYTGSSSHQSDADGKAVRDRMAPVFDTLKIDLALEGHDHIYEIIGPVKNKALVPGEVSNQTSVAPNTTDNLTGKLGGKFDVAKGTLYFLNNSAGKKKYLPRTAAQMDAAFPQTQITNYFGLFSGRFGQNGLPTFSNVTVSTDSITISTYSVDSLGNSTLFDAFSIIKTPKPTAFAVTGSGSYCQGSAGLPVGLANSELGVTYTITPGGATVVGTGSAITFGNKLAGTYTIAGTNLAGTIAMTGSAVIVENTPVVPSFFAFTPYEVGATPAVLPLTSNNAINGTWNPAAINTSTAGIFPYTFTPDAGQCAVSTTVNITIYQTSLFQVTQDIGTTLFLSWPAVSGAASYAVFYRPLLSPPSGLWIGNSVSYPFIKAVNLTPGTVYECKYTAYKANGGAVAGGTASGTFTPAHVAFEKKYDIGTTCQIDWDDWSGWASSYVFQYQIGSTWFPAVRYANNGKALNMTPGVNYQCRVIVYRNGSLWGTTEIYNFTPQPVVFTLGTHTTTACDISWNSLAPWATSRAFYYRPLTSPPSGTWIGNTTNLNDNVHLTGLTPNVTYECKLGVYLPSYWGETMTGQFMLTSGTKELSSNVGNDGINVYPNPFKEQVNLDLFVKEENKVIWNIYDMTGKVVLSGSENITAGYSTFNIDATGLSKGVYMLNAIMNDQMQSFRIMKQ